MPSCIIDPRTIAPRHTVQFIFSFKHTSCICGLRSLLFKYAIAFHKLIISASTIQSLNELHVSFKVFVLVFDWCAVLRCHSLRDSLWCIYGLYFRSKEKKERENNRYNTLSTSQQVAFSLDFLLKFAHSRFSNWKPYLWTFVAFSHWDLWRLHFVIKSA